MNILYGVAGDGMGHAMRSAVLGEYLESIGHSLTFVSSGGAERYLRKRWPKQVVHVNGLNTMIVQNRVSVFGTVLANAMGAYRNVHSNLLSHVSMAISSPDLVITDFEPSVAHHAYATSKPLLAVDNIHFLNRCSHPQEMIHADYLAASHMYSVCETLIPAAHRYLITTFARVPITRDRTSLHLPILRNEVLDAKDSARDGEHVVAYFNDKANHELIATVLRTLSHVPFRVYGKSSIKRPIETDNVTYCPFSDEAFIRDVASSRAVIGGSGFTFMTEAIYLGKPMLALPYGHQFEQTLNALYLERLQYGERCGDLTPEKVRGFLEHVPEYTERLRLFRHDRNQDLYESVVAAIDGVTC